MQDTEKHNTEKSNNEERINEKSKNFKNIQTLQNDSSIINNNKTDIKTEKTNNEKDNKINNGLCTIFLTSIYNKLHKAHNIYKNSLILYSEYDEKCAIYEYVNLTTYGQLDKQGKKEFSKIYQDFPLLDPSFNNALDDDFNINIATRKHYGEYLQNKDCWKEALINYFFYQGIFLLAITFINIYISAKE